jgi:hypothetical protein
MTAEDMALPENEVGDASPVRTGSDDSTAVTALEITRANATVTSTLVLAISLPRTHSG